MVRRGQQETLAFEPTDQFAAELSYFSTCVLQDRTPEPSGIEGLTDVRIVEAIYRSARDGRPVTLPRIARVEAPSAEAEGERPWPPPSAGSRRSIPSSMAYAGKQASKRCATGCGGDGGVQSPTRDLFAASRQGARDVEPSIAPAPGAP